MTRRVLTIFAVVALMAALALPALAADLPEDYTGELDPATGLPKGSYEDPNGESGSYIVVDNAFSYDPAKKLFITPIGSTLLCSNIPNGAVLPDGHTVSIQIPNGITAQLYRDSVLIENPAYDNIYDTGFYVLQLEGNGLFSSERFTFVIMPELTNQMHEMRLPEGFSFQTILQDGTPLDFPYSNYYTFLEDGTYRIIWQNDTIHQQYIVEFTLDRSAPTLALPEVADGTARSEVTLTDLEPGCHIVLKQGNKTQTIRNANHVLRESGEYVLTVYDPAGNYTQYAFTIEVYLNISAVAVILMTLLIIAGILLYSRRVRKTARVG